jgi:hypothetical protein
MGTRNYTECQAKQVPSAFNLQHSQGVARQCHRLPRHKQRAAQPGLHTQGCTPGPLRPQLNSQASHKQRAAQPGLHTQGCTPGPTRPQLNSQASHKQRAAQPGLHTQGCTPGPSRPQLNFQASKALTTTQPARPLPNTQTSKAFTKLPGQQGPCNCSASKASTTHLPTFRRQRGGGPGRPRPRLGQSACLWSPPQSQQPSFGLGGCPV